MNFRTRVDITNRQAKQYEKTNISLSGKTVFGLPYEDLSSGVDLTTTGQTYTDVSISSTFSGNTGTTVYTWGYSGMTSNEGELSAITPSNSGTTQFTGPTWVGYDPFTTVDGYSGYSNYSATTYDLDVTSMVDLGSGAYSGTILTGEFFAYDGDSLDWTGSTIWVDVSGITRTSEIVVSKDPVSGYILTSDATGKGTWQPAFVGDSISTGLTYNDANQLTVHRNNGLSGLTASIDIMTGLTINGQFSATSISINGGEDMSRIANSDDFLVFGNVASTGLINGALMTTDSSTTFKVAAGTGVISDSSLNPENPTYNLISWGDMTGNTLTYLSGDVLTFISINSGGTIEQYPLSSPPNQTDKRNEILLGAVAHSDQTTITNLYNSPTHISAQVSQHEDLTSAVGSFSISGNFVQAISSSLELYKEVGLSYLYGGNFQADKTSPSTLIAPIISGSSTPSYPLVYAKGDEVIGISGYSIDTNNYDPDGLGTITGIGVNKFVAHRIWHLPLNNLLVFQYGQYEYNSLNLALNGFSTENFVEPPGLGIGAYLISVIITEEGETDLSNSSTTKFIQQAKFAGAGGGGGAIADTLQTAYNNSISPEIVTDASSGSVDFKVGSGSDSDDVITIQNSGGTINSSIDGEGYGYFKSINVGTGNIISGSTNNSIIGGTGNTITTGVTNCVVIGGVNITGDTSDMVFVPDLIIDGLTSTDPLATDANGKIVAGASDIRLKTNIKDLTSALNKINQLRGVSYEWTEASNMGSDITKFGLIAQEVQKVIPDMVRERSKDGDMLTLSYTEIVPWLIEAIKELSSDDYVNSRLETQTIIAEDNSIELNYNGTHETSIGGGITVLNSIKDGVHSEIKTDENGEWVMFPTLKTTLPNLTPKSTNDKIGKIGDTVWDDNHIYIKTNNGWKRTNLENF